jgi:hypothetical protein
MGLSTPPLLSQRTSDSIIVVFLAKPETDGWWASRNLAVIRAGVQSAREGRAVDVDAVVAEGD